MEIKDYAFSDFFVNEEKDYSIKITEPNELVRPFVEFNSHSGSGRNDVIILEFDTFNEAIETFKSMKDLSWDDIYKLLGY